MALGVGDLAVPSAISAGWIHGPAFAPVSPGARSLVSKGTSSCGSAGGRAARGPTRRREAGSMLTLTPTAAEVLRALVADAPIEDESGGIRISPAARTPEGTSLQLALVEAPEIADEEIDAGGAH